MAKRRVSVSMLSSYLYCARKLFLEKVLGFVEPEKKALVKGSIRHETYDEATGLEEGIVVSISEADEFEDIYLKYSRFYAKILRRVITQNKYRLRNVDLSMIDAYKEIWPFFQRESEIRAMNIWKYIEKHNVFGKELWDKLSPKIESEYKIGSESLLLNGIIDQIERYPEGDVPVELKTGSMPKQGVWPGHRIQIGAYAMMLEEKTGRSIKEGIIHYLDPNERRQVVINPFLKEEIKELRQNVRELLEGSDIPDFTANENKCMKCGLREKCFDEELLNRLASEKSRKP